METEEMQRQSRWKEIKQALGRWGTSVEEDAPLPLWRRPMVGYIVGFLAAVAGFLFGIVANEIDLKTFPGAVLSGFVLLIAFFWGVGPSIFFILLSLFVLDYLYFVPFQLLNSGWEGFVQLITFAISGIFIAVFANQRESARARAVKAERIANERARELNAIFEALTDSVVVTDDRGHVAESNKAARQMFGDDLRGMWQALQNDSLGKPLPEKQRPLARLFRGEVVNGRDLDGVLVEGIDGQEYILDVQGAPIEGQNRSRQAVLIYRDVTERRRLGWRTEEALNALLRIAELLVIYSRENGVEAANRTEVLARNLIELIKSILECFHVELLVVNADGNKARLFVSMGLTAAQERNWKLALERQPLEKLFGGEDLVRQLENNQALMLEGKTLPLHTRFVPYTVDTLLAIPIVVGSSLVSIMVIDNGSKAHKYTEQESSLAHLIARLIALTLEKERLQQERASSVARELAMQEANRRMEEFLSIVSHELKSPITVVKGNIQLAERRLGRVIDMSRENDELERRLQAVQALLEKARSHLGLQNRLVNELLEVSRIQSSRMRLLKDHDDLVRIVREAVEDQRQIAVGRQIALELPDEQKVPVYVDSDRINQVVTNYLTNAIKYSSSRTVVTVRLLIAGEYARVEVSDQGPGLTKEEQGRIWERFYRAQGIEVQDGVGIGLGVGLYVSHNIIHLHDGQVGVESEPGKGSTFWFTLPLTEELNNNTRIKTLEYKEAAQ